MINNIIWMSKKGRSTSDKIKWRILPGILTADDLQLSDMECNEVHETDQMTERYIVKNHLS